MFLSKSHWMTTIQNVKSLHCPKNDVREPNLLCPPPFCDCLGPVNKTVKIGLRKGNSQQVLLKGISFLNEHTGFESVYCTSKLLQINKWLHVINVWKFHGLEDWNILTFHFWCDRCLGGDSFPRSEHLYQQRVVDLQQLDIICQQRKSQKSLLSLIRKVPCWMKRLVKDFLLDYKVSTTSLSSKP